MAKKKLSASRRCVGMSITTGERCKRTARKGMRTCGRCKGTGDPVLEAVSAQLTDDMSLRRLKQILDVDKFSESQQQQFAFSDNPLRRIDIAQSRQVSPELLLCMAREEDDLKVMEKMIRNSRTPVEALPYLLPAMTLDDWPKKNMSAKIAGLMAHHNATDEQCRNIINLCINMGFGERILREMNANKSFMPARQTLMQEYLHVLPAMIRSMECTPEMLRTFADSPLSEVRCRVAAHPATSLDTLRILSQDESPYVRQAVALNDNSVAAILSDIEGPTHVLQSIAGNISTPSARLDELSRHQDSSVRSLVGFNINTDPATLRRLSHDASASVRIAVANNRTCRPDVLTHLANDTQEQVVECVAANMNLRRSDMTRLAAHSSSTVKKEIIRRHDCGAETLKILVQSSDADIVFAALEATKRFLPRQRKEILAFVPSEFRAEMENLAEPEF